jgi:hypothetical protein
MRNCWSCVTSAPLLLSARVRVMPGQEVVAAAVVCTLVAHIKTLSNKLADTKTLDLICNIYG